MVEVVEVGRKGVGKMVGGGGEDDVTGETGGSCFTISSSVSKSEFWPGECSPEIEVEPAYRRRNERESPRSESSPGDAAERERQKVRQDRSAVCA